MKKIRIPVVCWLLAAVCCLASCYKLISTYAPSEVEPGQTFEVSFTVVDDGSDTQNFVTDWSYAGVRVPKGWTVTVPQGAHRQFAEDWVYYRDGSQVNSSHNMEPCDKLTQFYNLPAPSRTTHGRVSRASPRFPRTSQPAGATAATASASPSSSPYRRAPSPDAIRLTSWVATRRTMPVSKSTTTTPMPKAPASSTSAPPRVPTSITATPPLPAPSSCSMQQTYSPLPSLQRGRKHPHTTFRDVQ